MPHSTQRNRNALEGEMMEYTMSLYRNRDDMISDMRDEITQLRAELANLSAENERLREAFTKPDHAILEKVCYGVNCYPDELADVLETYWEALK